MTDKLPYPKSIIFIVSNEFCERFCYYGMRAILVLYLTESLKYDEPTSKIIYHTFAMFVYFFPLIGGIISDSWLGKFKTILFVSMIYASGSILLAATAAEPLKIPQQEFSLTALLLIAVGTGGIKPCVSAFGGDQFILPQQEAELATFFSLFYFAINAGSLLSTLLTPVLRNDVHCFGKLSCYPLAFAVPGLMMVLATVIFALGKPLYKINEPKGNVLVDVAKCMTYAATHRKVENPGNHWLDRSEAKHGAKLVSDIKILLKVLLIYVPLPVFWALFDQQGSGWTFQAVRMNGDVGFYTILPDQMQVTNPLLILIFIPLFTYVVYPLLDMCHLLRTPLQRICCGGFMASGAFAMSAFVSLALEKTYPVLPVAGEAQVRMYDTTKCRYSFSTMTDVIPVPINGYYVDMSVKIPDKKLTVDFTFTSDDASCTQRALHVEMSDKTAYGIYINDAKEGYYVDQVKKSEDGYPLVRTLASNITADVTYTHLEQGKSTRIPGGYTNLVSLEYLGTYRIEDLKREVEFKMGGTYTVMINQELNTVRTIVVTNPNSVHMLWLLPQYFVITAAEIMFSITGLEFAYSQAPTSMKAVLQACYLLTTAVGNLLVVVIEAMKVSELQSHNFFLYTGLMAVDMLFFMWLAIKYKYEVPEDSDTPQEG